MLLTQYVACWGSAILVYLIFVPDGATPNTPHFSETDIFQGLFACVEYFAGDMYPAPQNYPNHPNYPEVKHKLKERCKWIQLEQQDATTNLLHLNITETEDHKYNVKGLRQPQLFKILDFWFDNPYIANMDLKFWTESYVKNINKRKYKEL